ncbi:MAG TPA: hypothetical protein VFE21_00745 [Rubrobacteraceae bacterium]|nr:hypothetical protein [Rubrobacteraceae bacterium]
MPDETPRIELDLSLDEAKTLHASLEELLESGQDTPALQRFYRLLGWRILAAERATGLTGRISELARRADTLEEYEATRDEFLGPILDGLERGENRDP